MASTTIKTPKYETCSDCHGLGEVVTGESQLAGACAAAWGTCATCHGTRIEAVGYYTCGACLDTGVNVYDDAFDVANPQPCEHCHTDPEPPTPAASGSITWSGKPVNAPGFTQDQFDRAMGRAFVDALEVKRDRHNGRYLVGHPDSYAYAVSREHCGCKAGEVGTPCKHRALLIAHLDIRIPAITKQWSKLNAERPARKAVHA